MLPLSNLNGLQREFLVFNEHFQRFWESFRQSSYFRHFLMFFTLKKPSISL